MRTRVWEVCAGTASQEQLSVSLVSRMPAKGKKKPCEIVCVDGTLLPSQDTDSTDEQGMAGLRKARPWSWQYPGSSSSQALRRLDVDAAREAIGNGDMASRSADLGQTGTWAMNASNASRSSLLSCASCCLSSCVLPRSASLSSTRS